MLVELVAAFVVGLGGRVLVDELEGEQVTHVLDLLLVASDAGGEFGHEPLQLVEEGTAEVEQEGRGDGEGVDADFAAIGRQELLVDLQLAVLDLLELEKPGYVDEEEELVDAEVF